jgi:tetratricopeptide (TPR) repeat protein
MEHFRPFVHVSRVISALGHACRRLLPHGRTKTPGQSVDHSKSTSVVFPWTRVTDLDVEEEYAAYVQAGIKCAMRGEYGEAVSYFEYAAEAGWKHPFLYYNWGLTLSHMGEHVLACEMYLNALELKPDCVDAAINWGVSLAALERYEEAVGRYRQAAEIDPNVSDIYFNWGCSLLEIDEPQEACVMFEKAAQLAPKDAQAHYNWAISLARTGQAAAAAKHLTAFIKLARGRFKDEVENARSLLPDLDQ